MLPVDKPWEVIGVTPLYVGARNSGGYEMYYRSHWFLQRGERPPRYDHPQYTSLNAYAISDDGIHWEKPVLQLVDGPADSDRTICPPYPMPKGKTNQNNLLNFGFPRDLLLHGNVRDPAMRITMFLDPRSPSRVSFGRETP